MNLAAGNRAGVYSTNINDILLRVLNVKPAKLYIYINSTKEILKLQPLLQEEND